MNERIKQLALQAGIDFFNSTDPEYSGREYCEAWTEQQQKFAELIVRECVTMLEQHHPFTKDPEAYLYAISLIEEHFGVEE
jgi:hypothetical protein